MADHRPTLICDPAVNFGAATVPGTRVAATVLAELVWVGDGVDEVAVDYGVDRLDVLWCCAWWVREVGIPDEIYGPRSRRRWRAWAEHAVAVLAGRHEGPLCDPDDYEVGPPDTTPRAVVDETAIVDDTLSEGEG